MVTVVNVCQLELNSTNIFLLCELFYLVFTLVSSVQASVLDCRKQEVDCRKQEVSAQVCDCEAECRQEAL